jgi:hypothetical protein
MEEYIVRVYDNRTEWFNKDGDRHRIDGPAIEYANGYKAWWINGKLHREDGPAVEYADGSKEWYQNGQRHRIDGPAVEWVDGYKAWWFNGREYTEAEYHKVIAPVKELTMPELEKLLGYKVKIKAETT